MTTLLNEMPGEMDRPRVPTDGRIRAVAFDWGGVLIDNPASAILSYCSGVLGVATDRFAAAFEEAEPAFQTGAMSETAFWAFVAARLGVPPPLGGGEPSLWGRALRHAYSPRPAMFALAASLRRQGIRVAILSNTELPALAIYRERHEGLFDQVVLSCLEGVRKPFPEIYHIAAERLGVLPGELLFVDDREENVEGARRAGLLAIGFASIEATIASVNAAVA